MPLYDYDCSACGRRFEVAHGVHAEGPTACPICGKGPIHKAISAPAVHFKGTGWAKRDRRATATPGTSKASGDGSSSEGGPKGDESGSTSSSGTTAATATKSAEAGSTSKPD
ncbi:MAG: FmdB family zinc ribbon protein [Candidatus Limnocylindrales bacterium]